ncbi:MAG: hypothetical protein R2731_09680 [Nocardioides sp.]
MLHPVINITSAKLILGADAAPRFVPQAAIDSVTPGVSWASWVRRATSLRASGCSTAAGLPAWPPDGGLRLLLSDRTAPRPVPGGGTSSTTATTSTWWPSPDRSGQPSRGVPLPAAQRRRRPRQHAGGAGAGHERGGVVGVGRVAGPGAAWRRPRAGGVRPARLGEPLAYAGGDSGIPDDALVGDVVEVDGQTLLLTGAGPARRCSRSTQRSTPTSPRDRIAPTVPPRCPTSPAPSRPSRTRTGRTRRSPSSSGSTASSWTPRLARRLG